MSSHFSRVRLAHGAVICLVLLMSLPVLIDSDVEVLIPIWITLIYFWYRFDRLLVDALAWCVEEPESPRQPSLAAFGGIGKIYRVTLEVIGVMIGSSLLVFLGSLLVKGHLTWG